MRKRAGCLEASLPSDRSYALWDPASSRVKWVQDGSQKSTKFLVSVENIRGGLAVVHVASKRLAQLQALGHRDAHPPTFLTPLHSLQPWGLGGDGAGMSPHKEEETESERGDPTAGYSLAQGVTY